MRARNIKPGFYENEELAECSLAARLLFPGLWMMADREGRLEDKPRRIKAKIFPYESFDVEPLLEELQSYGFILRYVFQGSKYIQVIAFAKHQRPHPNEIKSTIPPPVIPPMEEALITKVESAYYQGSNDLLPKQEALCPDIMNPSSLNPSSLNPSSLNPSSLNDDSLNDDSLNERKNEFFGATAPSLPVDNSQEAPPPDETKPERHKHGEYGWVRLTDDEYQRLITDHGEKNVLHYIAVVDEKAQQTGNKNRWKDWNLTVRNAIRNCWGGPRGSPQAPDERKTFVQLIEEKYGHQEGDGNL